MHMKRRVSTAVLVVSLAVGGVACGSSGSSAKTTPEIESTTTVAAADTPATTPPSSGDASSVQWVPEMGTGTVTVTWTKDKTFDPGSLTVKVGDIVEIEAEPGASVAALGPNENGDDAKTVTPGMSESFTFTEAGTFKLYNSLTGTSFTVTVTG